VHKKETELKGVGKGSPPRDTHKPVYDVQRDSWAPRRSIREKKPCWTGFRDLLDRVDSE
jgi:hypothetical protein